MSLKTSVVVLKTFADLPQPLRFDEKEQVASTGSHITEGSASRVIYPPREALDRLRQPLTPGERMVLDVFDRCLPIEWEIYIQPHLNGLRPDFVLLNPAVGIGVFEVKDWNLDAMRYFVQPRAGQRPELWAERDGEAFSIERSNPVAAVNRYKQDINDIYCPRLDGRNGLGAITAGVIFPFADADRAKGLLAPFLTKDGRLAVYQPISGRREIAAADIAAIFPESTRRSSRIMSEERAADLRGWLVEPDFATTQREPLPPLDANQRRLVEKSTASGYRRVRGSAGSGKSIVLAARAARLAAEGKSVLVATYNITLWHYLRDLIVRGLAAPSDMRNITFTHFHHWCRDVCVAVGWEGQYDALWRGLPDVDQDLKRRNPVLARQIEAQRRERLGVILTTTMPSLASAAMEQPDAPHYDAVLVDEGQDYRPNWWAAIRKARRPDGEIMLVADATQDVYGLAGAWTDTAMTQAGFSGPPAQLKVSYRLPARALNAARDYATRFLPARLADLPEPIQGQLEVEPCTLRWVQCDAGVATLACVEEIRSLMTLTGQDGLGNADIVFLSDDAKSGAEVVETLEHKGVKAISTLYESREASRRQKMAFYMGDARLKATTLHSFKGWEARLLVVRVSQAWTPESRALVYAALTRLKRDPNGSWLTVVSSAPELEDYGRGWANHAS